MDRQHIPTKHVLCVYRSILLLQQRLGFSTLHQFLRAQVPHKAFTLHVLISRLIVFAVILGQQILYADCEGIPVHIDCRCVCRIRLNKSASLVRGNGRLCCTTETSVFLCEISCAILSRRKLLNRYGSALGIASPFSSPFLRLLRLELLRRRLSSLASSA